MGTMQIDFRPVYTRIFTDNNPTILFDHTNHTKPTYGSYEIRGQGSAVGFPALIETDS